ncbi:MAG: hypothetical protein HFI98_05455 [Lachnospiraceae bacterium]|nr:hypothetical protein [Lachnospiraceae bacterium]
MGVFDYAGTYENGSRSVWAEDVIYIEEMQKYVTYFCTSSTYIKSKLCYATADRPEGPYAYQGTLLYSGFTAQDIEDTDVYEYVDSETAAAIYLSGGHNSIEGPYIQYDADSGYYYLYVSYGGLERTGGYQIRVFRSKTPDGEYTDMNGSFPSLGCDHSKYGLKLSGNYYMPGCKYAYMATGGQSAFRDTDGKLLLHQSGEKDQ